METKTTEKSDFKKKEKGEEVGCVLPLHLLAVEFLSMSHEGRTERRDTIMRCGRLEMPVMSRCFDIQFSLCSLTHTHTHKHTHSLYLADCCRRKLVNFLNSLTRRLTPLSLLLSLSVRHLGIAVATPWFPRAIREPCYIIILCPHTHLCFCTCEELHWLPL